MKRFIRSAPVQSTLAFLLSVYLHAALATMRWRFENLAALDAVIDAPDGFVLCLWHRRITIGFRVSRLLRDKPRRGLVSLSPDGEFITKTAANHGFPTIRGSAGKKSDPAKAKGGAQAFRDAVKWLRSGGCMIVTPDGPRGPSEEMTEGALMMAKVSGLPILLMGVGCDNPIRLNTWDKGTLPRPFARGALVFDGPHPVPRELSGEAFEQERERLGERLKEADARAETLAR